MEVLSAKWTHSVLYLTLICLFIYYLQTQISSNLLVNHDKIHLKKNPDLPFRFRHDGTFKILQVADMHFGMGMVTRCRDVMPSEFDYCSDLNTTLFLERMIEAEKPDFIAFTGDNIFGPSTTDAAESLVKAFGPAVKSGLPWAAVLGNHDQESTMNREELMNFISLMDYSVSQINPSAQVPKIRKIDGFGNYDLTIKGPLGSLLANSSLLNLYFLDSGDRETVGGFRTYGWIKESQLHWAREVSQRYSKGSKQEKVKQLLGHQPPALAFFHIPILEIRKLYYTVYGKYQEAVACSIVKSGVLQTFQSMGDVKAVFIGHDHKNDFCGNLQGIWFCYGGGFGYHAYGKAGWHRRARVVVAELGKGENTWTGVQRIKTWKRLDDEKLSKIDEQVLWESTSRPSI